MQPITCPVLPCGESAKCKGADTKPMKGKVCPRHGRVHSPSVKCLAIFSSECIDKPKPGNPVGKPSYVKGDDLNENKLHETDVKSENNLANQLREVCEQNPFATAEPKISPTLPHNVWTG